MLLSSLAQGSRKGFEGWLRSVIVVKVEVHEQSQEIKKFFHAKKKVMIDLNFRIGSIQ